MRCVLAICILITPGLLAQSTVTGSRTVQGSWDASGASATKPAKAGPLLPATCGAGEFFFNTAATSGQNIYLCNPANTWTQVSTGGVTSVFGRSGPVAAQSGDYNFTQIGGTVGSGQLPAAGGDISGGLTTVTVKALQGKAVGTTAPATGQVLTWNGTQWTPQAVASSVGGDISGTISAATVKAIQGETIGTAAPSTGQVLTWNGTQWTPQAVPNSVGGDISGTVAAATVKAIQGKTVGTTAPSTGQVLTWNGTQWTPQAVPNSVGGDISGTVAAATVQAIQGRAIQSLAPAAGQVLTWNGTQWAPQNPTGGGTGGTAFSISPPYLLTGGVYYGPVFSLTPPNLQTWTWLNQGTASVTTTNGAMYLQTASSTVHSLSGQMMPIPPTPYTITATFLPSIYNFVFPGSTGGQTFQYPSCGLFWYQGSTTGGNPNALRTFGYEQTANTSSSFAFVVAKYHSPTSYWGDGGPLPYAIAGPIQMQLHDDGTTQTMQLSNDGANWQTIDSSPSTSVYIADHVGFYCDSFNSKTTPGMTLLSWQVH